MLPAEKIITEHYRLGSTCAILSRSFCNVNKIEHMGVISSTFVNGIREIREYERKVAVYRDFFQNNIEDMKKIVANVLRNIE